MAGTKNGGKAAASTNKSKYGADFYEELDQAYEYTQKDKL